MPTQVWTQDNFTKGELSPFMYGRAQVEQYFNGLKQAQNVLTLPTGAAAKRFGTLYQATLSFIAGTNDKDILFQLFQYLDVCIFQLVFSPTKIDIYLEGILVQTVSIPFDGPAIYEFSTTVIDTIFRFAGDGFAPQDLTVVFDGNTIAKTGGTAITGISSNAYTFGSAIFTAGVVLPVQFTWTGVPVTIPQIREGVTYFAMGITTTSAKIYTTAYNAKFDIDAIALGSIGTGAKLYRLNTWAVNPTVFRNLPFYDFNGGYDAVTFTPAAVSGSSIALNATGGTPFTAAHAGGAFIGGGGSAHISVFVSNVQVLIDIQNPFDGVTGIPGSVSLLAEPAWSATRGWPSKVSSYQNRGIYANTPSLRNGIYLSVINDYQNLTNYTNDDDDGISWYPSSNDVNVIRFIVPFRSLTVHTNSGIYSNPLSEISAVTPSTFTLQLQDSTPSDVLQPQAIDNQIIVISGNDVHTMLWDGINNAYTSNIVSIVNEQVIRDPVDEASFADLARAGSRYVFIINDNGSMAVYQTLQSESVSGFTPHIMEQSYGSAQFRQCASSFDGRCWFVVQREIASALSGINITAFTSSTLTAVASNFDTEIPIAITFTTTGTLPASTPALALATYYWAIGVTADTFNVYASQEDALAAENAFVFTSAGTTSKVVPWPLATIFTLEELNQDIKLDCAVYHKSSTPFSTVTAGVLFNAQNVKIWGDRFGFDAIGVSNQVTIEAHGEVVEVEEAYIGFPINLVIEPMPIAIPKGEYNTLTKPTHIRFARFMFNNTIGGTINDIPIALNRFDAVIIGEPPVPARGIFEMSIMKGWDDFNYPSFTIEHNEPFDIQFISVSYSVDI